MGNMILNLFGMGMFYGLNSALETLVSQAYGAKNLYLCGVYLQRARMIVTLFYIPIMMLFLSSGYVLKACG